MSLPATAPAPSPSPRPGRQPRTALPRPLEVARRARLRVVPRRRVRAPRVPFVTLVSLVLVGGVVGLLCFNTQMQQASFTATTLQDRADSLGARQQTLEMEIERLAGPNHVMAAAREAGLVGPGSPAQLWLATGAVTGVPSPATADSAPRLLGRAPAKPAVIDPAPDVVTVPDPADAAARAAAQDAATAAAIAQQQAEAAAQAAAQAQQPVQQPVQQPAGGAAGRR